MSGFEVDGLTEFQRKLKSVVDNYPVQSEQLLTKVGNKFRKSVREKTPVGKSTKRKLIKSYKVSRVQGYGQDQWIEFRSNSPHYHLVERGHKVVVGGRLSKANGGQRKRGNGRVAGKVDGQFMLERTVREYDTAFPKEVEKMVDKFIKKLG